MQRVVMFSGGVGSWFAARKVAERYGTDGLILLFADTMEEDPDLYVFVTEAARDVGGKLVVVKDGRDPWTLFRDQRMIGNARADLCSRILKREVCDRWLAANCDPSATVVYIGIDWSEAHRFAGTRARMGALGWKVEAPLCDDPEAGWLPPFPDKVDMLKALEDAGLPLPRLYRLKFAHNNCGGFCIKAGMGHFRKLLEELPEVFARHEAEEEKTRRLLGKDVAVLRSRKGGVVTPFTLRKLREEHEAGRKADPHDVGGCGCFVGTPGMEEEG